MNKRGVQNSWMFTGAVVLCLIIALLMASCGKKPSDTPSDNRDYAVAFKTGDAPTVFAGKIDQGVAELIVEEAAKGSLKPGQTFTLQLPEGACWSDVPVLNNSKSANGGVNGAWVPTSPEARTIKYTVSFTEAATGTSEAAKLYFGSGKIITSADFNGDVKAKVNGSDGSTSEVILARVVSGLSISSTTRDLRIGLANQTIGDITISEIKSEMIGSEANVVTITDQNHATPNLVKKDTTGNREGYIELVAPSGVLFSGLPKVEVVGDLSVDTSFNQARTFAEQKTLRIPINATSSVPSKVILKDIKVTVNRTVSEGELQIKVGGTALADQYMASKDKVLFVPERYVGSIKVGNIVTPSPE